MPPLNMPVAGSSGGGGAKASVALPRLLLLVAYAAVILWLSLTPNPASPPGILGWDKLQHAGAFALFALLAGWTFTPLAAAPARAWILAMVLAVVCGALIEVLQGLCTETRSAELGDLAADAAGAGIVCLLMVRGKPRRLSLQEDSDRNRGELTERFQERNSMLAAVIFDFDGIIVDTEPLHYKAFQEVLVPMGLGYSWEEYLHSYIGFDDRDAFREAFRAAGRAIGDRELQQLIELKAGAFQREIITGVEPYPGVVELVRSIAGNLPLALCSGALPGDIHPILRQLGIDRAFDVVVTAADVEASKPDPASYLLAMAHLQAAFPKKEIAPACCLAIEDTPAGIASATGAGMKALAVTNSYPEESLGGACRVVPSLAGIDLEGLRFIFQ